MIYIVELFRKKSLGVQVKFCLDDDTLELQKSILKQKREEKDKKELEQKQEQKTEEQKEKEETKINSNNNNINNNINNNSDQNAMKAKGTELDLIKEGEEEEKEDEEETGNLINTSMTKEQHNDSYLLEKINSLDDSKGDADVENIPIFAGFSQFRNTVNSFNNKKFMFPKLHNKLRETKQKP